MTTTNLMNAGSTFGSWTDTMTHRSELLQNRCGGVQLPDWRSFGQVFISLGQTRNLFPAKTGVVLDICSSGSVGREIVFLPGLRNILGVWQGDLCLTPSKWEVSSLQIHLALCNSAFRWAFLTRLKKFKTNTSEDTRLKMSEGLD